MELIARIDVDQLGELEEKMGSLLAAVQAVIPIVAGRTFERIIELAANELNTTYPIYIAALELNPQTNEISLDASKPGTELAWQVEHGTAGGDMKERLNGRTSMVIPFRHSPPGSKSVSGMPMGSPYAKAGWWAKQARAIGKEAHTKAKQLGPGQRLNAAGMPRMRAHHVEPIYQDMVRKTTGPSGGRNQYMTFRTMHEMSPGWQYPAKEGHHFFERVTDDDVARFVDEAVKKLLED